MGRMSMKAKRLNKKVRYTGETTLSLDKDGIYMCLGKILDGPQAGYLIIIDESKEDYVYAPDEFEFIE